MRSVLFLTESCELLFQPIVRKLVEYPTSVGWLKSQHPQINDRTAPIAPLQNNSVHQFSPSQNSASAVRSGPERRFVDVDKLSQ